MTFSSAKLAQYFLMALSVVAILASCGGGGGSSSSSTPTNSTKAVINQSGGQVTLNDGTAVIFAAGIVKDSTSVTISTLPPEASTSTEISSLSSRVRIEFPIDALTASGALPDDGITISIPISGVATPMTTAVATKGVTGMIGQSYRYVKAKLSAGTSSVILYGKAGVAQTQIQIKIYQSQLVSFGAFAGKVVDRALTIDWVVERIQLNVPTAGQILKIQHIGSSGNFSTDYSFVDSFSDRLLPNGGLPQGKIPLVLVHGIQIACEGGANAYMKTWEQFIPFFFSSQGQVLRDKYQLYTFSYQTDLHIQDNGRLLATKLKATFGNVPTVIVAHSMGGLVTRSAMVQHASIGAQIGGVITLGTPHHGTKVIQNLAGGINTLDSLACVPAPGSAGADDLTWDNFDDPSKACGNSFLCGTAGINTTDTASNFTKYIPYAGVWDAFTLLCASPAMCAGSNILKTAGYFSDGMVPEVSARFKDPSHFFPGPYLEPWYTKPRTYQEINHATIHDNPKIYTQNPDGYPGGLVQDLLDLYGSLPPPAAPTDITPPSIPTGLTATALSSSQINLTWSASTDNVSVAGYKIYRGANLLATTATLAYSDSGLSPSTQYCYTVSAFDAAGNESGPSIQQCASTQAGGTVPTAPTGISATAGNGQATISWNAVAGVTYNLYMASVSGVTKVNYSTLTNGMQHVGVTPPYTHTGLTNGTSYYFVVTAVDANGESAESNEVSATPQAVPVITASTLNDTGITAIQCYQAGSDVLVDCGSAGAMALNSAQDGMAGRDANAATNSNTDGKLGFSFTSVPAAGSDPGGCVQDNVTGLMWEVKTTDGGLRDWNKTYTNYDSTTSLQKWDGTAYVAPTQAEIDAPTNSVGFKNSVNAQSQCGYGDWRLPTADELQSIVDHEFSSPAKNITWNPAIDSTWFPNTQAFPPIAGGFWSASPFVGGPGHAWFVNFGDGYVGDNYRSFSGYVRLVRADQSPTPPRYTVSADGQEVTDNQTKLIWRRCAEGMNWDGSTCTGTASTFTHEAALQLAATQASSTGITWRLPNIKELSSIADRTFINPAIDPMAFPATPTSVFWSASPFVDNPIYAWVVSFGNGYIGNGYVYYYLRSGSYYVRLVRDVPAPAGPHFWQF